MYSCCCGLLCASQQHSNGGAFCRKVERVVHIVRGITGCGRGICRLWLVLQAVAEHVKSLEHSVGSSVLTVNMRCCRHSNAKLPHNKCVTLRALLVCDFAMSSQFCVAGSYCIGKDGSFGVGRRAQEAVCNSPSRMTMPYAPQIAAGIQQQCFKSAT